MAGVELKVRLIGKGGPGFFTALCTLPLYVAGCLFNRKKRTNNNQFLWWKWKSRTEEMNSMKVRVFLLMLGVYLSVNEHLQRNFLFTNPALRHLGVPCISIRIASFLEWNCGIV